MKYSGDTIVALSTPTGSGAIGVIRLSGPDALTIADNFFPSKSLTDQSSHSLHYGSVLSPDQSIIDEVVVGLFKAPHSYTKEDVVEISCHGSSYIIHELLALCIQSGARLARPGEFTLRAYMNGQMDLSQAEAVADLIASTNQSQHKLAMHQMKGGMSNEIDQLRQDLIEFASLIELENDFGEEDVEFADRKKLINLVQTLLHKIAAMKESFKYGNAIKNGVAVVIIGKPNVGKSTLLNQLLNEDRAIISDIPGTTRDVVEDSMTIDGIQFRFIDTAGIRETTDTIESIGIEKTFEQIAKAQIVIYLNDISDDHQSIAQSYVDLKIPADKETIIVLNKADVMNNCNSFDIEEAVSTLARRTRTISISAKEGIRIDKLRKLIVSTLKSNKVTEGDTIVSNVRHLEALNQTETSLRSVTTGLEQGLPSDLIALDIRHALHYLGEIAGTISSDDLLDSIFSNFCIGK